jgi:hypothetical protein
VNVVKEKMFFFFLLLLATASTFFPKTLLLYKGSENGYGISILSKYVIPALKEAHESYDIVDVESTNLSLEGYDAVISCYYSSKMKEAGKYLEKLSFFLMNGGKLFIINNIGASVDENGNLVPLAQLNAVYNFLGISYKSGWKKIEKAENLSYDRNYITSKPTYANRGVELYNVFSKNVRIIESMKIGDVVYPLITLGPNGGICLFNFAFDDQRNAVLNFSKLISTFIVGRMEMQNRILLIGRNENIEKALNYALIPYDVSKSVVDYVQKYMAVVEMNGSLPIVSPILMRYVSAGGTLMIVGSGNESVNVTSAMVSQSVFPLPPKFKMVLNTILRVVKPYPNSKVLVWTSKSNFPLVWALNFGKGKIIFYPIALTKYKFLRGLFVQTLMSNVRNSIQSIVNSYTVFIDDFPLPSYGIKRDMITKEFGNVTDGEFYYDIWWKDIEKMGKSMNLKYTTALVTSYNGKKTWPYDFSSFLSTPDPLLEMESVEKDGYELGLHGYNHQSPIAKNWTIKNLENAYKALGTFMKVVSSEGYRPASFVAPNNLIDMNGLKALKNVFPSLKLVGTSYDGTGTFSEYGVIDGIVILPRTTAGYYPVERLLKSSIFAVMDFGTFQYFFHPDDLFSSDRNPLHENWNEMKASMKEFLYTMQNYYPWLENHYAYEAAEIFKDYFTQVPLYERSENEVEVSLPYGSVLPRFFFFRTDGNVSLDGGKILYKYPSSNLYVIEMFSRTMKIKIF